MNRMLVIGIGSLIMTDDGIGIRVTHAIKKKLQEHGIVVIIGETDVQYCMDEIHPDDFLVVIDSMVQGKEPGSIEIVPLHDATKNHSDFHSQHNFSLINAISLTYMDIHGYLIGVEVAEIGFGFELSNALREKFENICHNVLKTVEDIMRQRSLHYL